MENDGAWQDWKTQRGSFTARGGWDPTSPPALPLLGIPAWVEASDHNHSIRLEAEKQIVGKRCMESPPKITEDHWKLKGIVRDSPHRDLEFDANLRFR